jgi:hypothetical protein
MILDVAMDSLASKLGNFRGGVLMGCKRLGGWDGLFFHEVQAASIVPS